MRAAEHTRYGPPEVVSIVERPKPSPADGELLIKVHVSTVNRTDCATRAGVPRWARPFTGWPSPRSKVLGCEFAGVVESVNGHSTLVVGDRVFGYNEGPFGAHAEYLVMKSSGSLARIPANVSFDDAAASTEGTHYALMVIDSAGVRAGQRVLVNGATGGIGSAAVQLLKHRGAHVTAVCPPEHVDLVRALGADRVIDFSAQDFTQEDQTYDVVLDAVGKSSFGRCRRLLTPKGCYLSSELGPRGENPFLALVTPLGRGRRVKFPIPTHDQAMVEHFASLLESGEYKPVIDRRYKLADIVEAHRYVSAGLKVGNVLVDVAS